jgi:hypothetical protein
MVAFFPLHTHHISKGRKAITCAIGIANMEREISSILSKTLTKI